MTTATKKKGVVSLKGKVKVIRETENGKKYLEKKTEPKLLVRLNRMDRE